MTRAIARVGTAPAMSDVQQTPELREALIVAAAHAMAELTIAHYSLPVSERAEHLRQIMSRSAMSDEGENQ